MTEILSGGLNWGSTQQAIVTMDKEGHPLTCCNPVTGECLGGGGSSDFSTAKITLVNGSSQSRVSCTLNPGLPDEEDSVPAYELELNVGKGESVEDVTAILYKGYASINTRTVQVMDVQGDAEYVQADKIIKISGDCEITIKTSGTR